MSEITLEEYQDLIDRCFKKIFYFSMDEIKSELVKLNGSMATTEELFSVSELVFTLVLSNWLMNFTDFTFDLSSDQRKKLIREFLDGFTKKVFTMTKEPRNAMEIGGKMIN